MYYFIIHANPQKGTKHAKYGGAYISCWINFPMSNGAEQLARYYIRANGWKIRRIHQRFKVSKADSRKKPGFTKYFDEAAKDGTSFVYHIYPKGRSNNTLHRITRAGRPRNL
jgi:hypothetical protein